MTRWIEDFHCHNCGSRLALKIESKKICFVCENEVQELSENLEEGEDFPTILEIQGKLIGSSFQILSRLHTPSHIQENNLIDERYADFVHTYGMCEEWDFIDLNTLFALARKMRNVKEDKRRNRRKISRLSRKKKTRSNRLPIAA